MPRIARKGNSNAGAPTKYKPEYCEEIIKFFDRPHYIKKKILSKSGEVIEVERANKLPTLEAFAHKIGVTTSTMGYWGKDHEEFLLAIKKSQQLQKEMLVQLGLSGDYEKVFAIFVAKNFTDMKDKNETEVNVQLGLSQILLDAINQRKLSEVNRERNIVSAEPVEVHSGHLEANSATS